MRETAEDLAALRALLDRSYAAAGPHARTIIEPGRRPGAEEIAGRGPR